MMDFQKLLDAMTESNRVTRSSYHLTLGDFVVSLEQAGSAWVKFDVGGSPTHPHSYSGYYSDLSFEVTTKRVKASTILDRVRKCIGRTFEGDKGGEFKMSEDTPLWRASYGCTGLAIVGAGMIDGVLVLVTKASE